MTLDFCSANTCTPILGQKNDYADAEVIVEVATHPTMREVPIKSISQQELQLLHRQRTGWIGNAHDGRAAGQPFDYDRHARIRAVGALGRIVRSNRDTRSGRHRLVRPTLASFIRRHGYNVVEVNRPDRRLRRINGEAEENFYATIAESAQAA